MRKCLAVTFILLGIFTWFRFAADCFDYTVGDDESSVAQVMLENGLSYARVHSDASPTSTYIKRPLHTKGYDFSLPAAFIFVLGSFIIALFKPPHSQFPHQAVTSFNFLRAPPACL